MEVKADLGFKCLCIFTPFLQDVASQGSIWCFNAILMMSGAAQEIFFFINPCPAEPGYVLPLQTV